MTCNQSDSVLIGTLSVTRVSVDNRQRKVQKVLRFQMNLFILLIDAHIFRHLPENHHVFKVLVSIKVIWWLLSAHPWIHHKQELLITNLAYL